MILSIGEILCDMVGSYENNSLNFNSFLGGAPLNLIVNASQAGSSTAFIGRVGNDVIGRFLIKEVQKSTIDNLDIQVDDEHNTTLAFVTLTDGEREFQFNRKQTADYFIDLNGVDFKKYKNLNIVHLGSLMLSQIQGIETCRLALKKAKDVNALTSFDVNFRTDIFRDKNEAISTYLEFVNSCDIIKFSDDELELFTQISEPIKAIKSLYKKDQLYVVTMGSKGSLYYYNGEYEIVPTEPIKPIDTTGCGDAFFGTFLANIEGKTFNKENLTNALIKANKKGALTTQFKGAIRL